MLLMIMRHGKAEKESPTRRDADRPLAERGRKQAAYIGVELGKSEQPLARPERVLSSRAERARVTAEIVAGALGLRVEFEDALTLDTSVREGMKLVRALAAAGKPVLLVGHNPQLEDLVSTLAGKEEEMRTGELKAVEISLKKGELEAELVGGLRLDGEE